MRKRLVVVVIAVFPWLSPPATAQPSTADEIVAIRGEIAALVARLDRLEQGSAVGASAAPASATARHYNLTTCNLSELAITLTEDSAIAAAAMMGDSSRPKVG